jgi:hypothetical protein
VEALVNWIKSHRPIHERMGEWLRAQRELEDQIEEMFGWAWLGEPDRPSMEEAEVIARRLRELMPGPPA